MKRMDLGGLPRDYIMSFFVRPGRVISPAAVREVIKKRPQISPASPAEVEAFIARRINDAGGPRGTHGFGPTSAVRVREVLELTKDGQSALPGFESHFAEFKSGVSLEKASKAKVARTLAAFANHDGGYVFIGIDDDGAICGLPADFPIDKFWEQLSDVITGNFTPFFRWERAVVEVGSASIGVAYAHPSSEPPIIASASYTADIAAGRIYFRYNRSVEEIRPGDLIRMLQERDRRAYARASKPTPTAEDASKKPPKA